MWKKTATTILASSLLLTGILTGCGSNNNADSGSNKQVEINVWAMGDEAKSLPQIADEFMKENPDIKVNVQALPWANAHDKLLTAVASKKGPDVIQMGTSWIPEFANAGALLDLTPLVDQYPEFKEDQFFEGAVNTTKYDGKIVGVPWYTETRVLFYRTDLLKEAGYEQAPKTWDELRDAAKKLAARGQGKYGITIDMKEQSLAFMFARQNGSKLLDDQNKPLFNRPEFVEAVVYLDGFFQDGSAPIDLGLDAVQGLSGEGIVPMFISGPWNINLIKTQAPDLEGKWAVAPLPTKKNNTSLLGGSDLSVFQYTEHKDEALKFIQYMSKPETQIKWMQLTKSLPTNLKAWDDPSLNDDPNYQALKEQLKNSEPMPMLTTFEETAQTFLKSFERIVRGGADVQSEMDTFNAEAEKILSK
ncbi:sugar ABC transporter substrate-binding protein [Paenibacillus sp. P96]|uniref:Sugar ABC transporter substrate-binding protein n=1 Tax=Paenibacillus zeirhizosphaerae TaxID=2987519 RepID=A0ABT9FSG1_9BACL|nr:sugar ABC transporter substrate-binding protein [Paenibacillus sp. P96]MDP4097671.1 sugar ABC transporter substrate-binding protein [Paenibacillus sp. P96]